MLKKISLAMSLFAFALSAPLQAAPENLAIDKAHTFITFKASHIGFGWMPGIFTKFDGEISYDPENPSTSMVTFTVQIPSMTTFHAERDKHLKSDDYLTAEKFETAKFTSTRYEATGENTANLHGDLTIKNTTKPVTFQVTELAARKDPWDNFRRAFEAEGDIKLKDFGIDDFGGAVETVTIKVSVEAKRAD